MSTKTFCYLSEWQLINKYTYNLYVMNLLLNSFDSLILIPQASEIKVLNHNYWLSPPPSKLRYRSAIQTIDINLLAFHPQLLRYKSYVLNKCITFDYPFILIKIYNIAVLYVLILWSPSLKLKILKCYTITSDYNYLFSCYVLKKKENNKVSLD